MNTTRIFIFLSAILLAGCQTAGKEYGVNFLVDGVLTDSFKTAPKSTEPMRDNQRTATLGDLMEQIMKTRDTAWIKKELGKPSEIKDLGRGYSAWIWRVEGKIPRKGMVNCTQMFFLDPQKKPNGWYHQGCETYERATGRTSKLKTHYGTMPKSTPLPSPKYLARKADFADALALLEGLNKEAVQKKYGKPEKISALASGQSLWTYKWSWTEWYTAWALDIGYMETTTYAKSCTYGIKFNAQGHANGYTTGNCATDDGEYGIISSFIPYAKVKL